jgi:hypothetical protein
MNNTALGFYALLTNTTGYNNTSVGYYSLLANTTGYYNTSVGSSSLSANTTGTNNTAVGYNALLANTTGKQNTALGDSSLSANTTGINNIAVGVNALLNNTTGINNTALGTASQRSNTTGQNNVAIGVSALSANTTGTDNVAIGLGAGNALTDDNNICIGSGVTGVAGDVGKTRIGGISGVNVGTAPSVLITASDQLGVNNSSRRFKENIEDMGDASQFIYKLRPVSFTYIENPEFGKQTGLIAEEVLEIEPRLVAFDSEGQPMTVCYQELSALLLNEIQRLHKRLEAVESL